MDTVSFIKIIFIVSKLMSVEKKKDAKRFINILKVYARAIVT